MSGVTSIIMTAAAAAMPVEVMHADHMRLFLFPAATVAMNLSLLPAGTGSESNAPAFELMYLSSSVMTSCFLML